MITLTTGSDGDLILVIPGLASSGVLGHIDFMWKLQDMMKADESFTVFMEYLLATDKPFGVKASEDHHVTLWEGDVRVAVEEVQEERDRMHDGVVDEELHAIIGEFADHRMAK